MKPVFSTHICSRDYDFYRQRLRADHGQCEDPRDTRGGKRWAIRISRSLRGKELLSTLIHEIIHAGDIDKNEKWVEHIADVCAEVAFSDHFFDLIFEGD